MTYLQNRLLHALMGFAALTAFNLNSFIDANDLPSFGKDTVLVWKIQNVNFESSFVVRIASFSPDRFIEWESGGDQGTVFMPVHDIQEAKGYVTRSLFEGGVDKRSKQTTTIWLSQRIYKGLKSEGKAKCRLDGIGGALLYLGQDSLTVEVNRTPRELPVIKASDERGAEFWFLDREDNPLMLKHAVRKYSQTLAVINTDQANTLRWIKGPKLTHPPQKQ